MTLRHRIFQVLAVGIFYVSYVSFLAPRLSGWGYHPDFWLVLVYLAAFSGGPSVGVLSGFGLGVVQDLFASPFPFYLISKTIVGMGWGYLRAGFSLTTPTFHIVALFVLSLVESAIHFLLLLATTRSSIPIMALFPTFLQNAMATVLISLPIFWIVRMTPRLPARIPTSSSIISAISR